MPSVITDAGRSFIAAEQAAGRAVNITTVRLANPVFADPPAPPAPSPALTDVQAPLVHTAPVSGKGKIDPDNVAYSVYLDTTVGDFTVTQVGYFADNGAGGLVLVMVSNIPPVYKRKNAAGQTGNNYKHTDILQIAGAAQATGITVPAATWQLDFHDALMRRPPFDVVVGTQAQVNAGEATHTVGQLSDAVVPAGARVLLLAGTHALAGNLALNNPDVVIEGESAEAVLALGAWNLTLAGARTQADLRVTRTTGTVSVSGAGSRFVGIDLDIAAVSVANGASAETTGTSGGARRTGSQVVINTTELAVKDNVVRLNEGETGAGVSLGSAGIEVERGTLADAQLVWNEAAGAWQSGVVGSLAELQRKDEKGAANGYALLDGAGDVPDAQIPAGIQRTAEKGAANGYASLDAAGDVPDAQLPAGIQRTAEKGAANGYASLDAAGDVPDGQIPAGVERTANKGVANGYASLDATGKVPSSQAPAPAAGSIAQSHLNTASGQVSTAGSTLVNLLLPGGEYGFYPRIGVTGGAPPHIFGEAQIAVSIDLTSVQGQFFTYVSAKAGSAQTNAIVWQRYIQASPPYDLGDGEVPLFVFALVERDGAVRAVYTAPDPPWANNGPTDIRPTHVRDGKPVQRRRVRPPQPARATPAALEAWLEAVCGCEVEEIEVTPAFKNSDMPLIPHPFLGNDLAGRTVVLLDPVAPLTARLAALHAAGESVNGLLHGDLLRIDNAALPRRCPPGVAACAAKWRNSR